MVTIPWAKEVNRGLGDAFAKVIGEFCFLIKFEGVIPHIHVIWIENVVMPFSISTRKNEMTTDILAFTVIIF